MFLITICCFFCDNITMCSVRLFQIGEHTGAAWCSRKDPSWFWPLLPLVCIFLSQMFLLLLPLSAQVGTSCVFTVVAFQPVSLTFSASLHLPFCLSTLMPTSCSCFLHLQENLYPLPHILLLERNEQGPCLCQSGGRRKRSRGGRWMGSRQLLGL